jgi:hypothetical protein
MNKEDIRQIISASINNLRTYDRLLLEANPKEEAINHRLAVYIEHEIRQRDLHYSVDVEYDKFNSGKKQIYDREGNFVNIRPDIIVHNRMSQDNNLLAIEAKKGNPIKKDRRTLKGLLDEPFNYQYAAIVSYFQNKSFSSFEIWFYQNKELVKERFQVPNI